MGKLTRLGKRLVLILALLAETAQAHEFWLEPLRYRIDPGGRLTAHIKVGQHFNGDSQPYLPDNTERFSLELGGRQVLVSPRMGDIPALDQRLAGNGLALLSHVSTDYILDYRDSARFEAFLQHEGLMPMLVEHRRRGLSMSGFKEAYQRFAKSLVQVGDGQGSDRRLGLEFEWVLEDNPYTASGTPLAARLYWRSEPLAGVQARLFVRHASRVDEQLLVTNDQGRVMLTPPAGSRLLLNAVQLRQPSALSPAPAGVAWKSYWASISFAVPD